MSKYKRKPITSHVQYEAMREGLVKQSMWTLKISQEQANKRIDALFASGLLEGFNPDNDKHCMIVDKFMQIEQP